MTELRYSLCPSCDAVRRSSSPRTPSPSAKPTTRCGSRSRSGTSSSKACGAAGSRPWRPVKRPVTRAIAAVTAAERHLRIGHLARASGFSQKTLRYYDEIGLLRPVEREVARIDTQLRHLRSLRRDLLTLRSRMDGMPASGVAHAGHVCPCMTKESFTSPARSRGLRSSWSGGAGSSRRGT